jgi:hypothetical protein
MLKLDQLFQFLSHCLTSPRITEIVALAIVVESGMIVCWVVPDWIWILGVGNLVVWREEAEVEGRVAGWDVMGYVEWVEGMIPVGQDEHH